MSAAWQPIETAPIQGRVLMYAPPEALYERPQGESGEYRVTNRRNWTWATHWMPLPAPPSNSPSIAPVSNQQEGGKE